jgi:hypothetical protein
MAKELTPQEAADDFHMMIGYCIAEWAKVEDELFRIFHAALQCPKEQAAIVYYRTPTIRSRLTLTDDAVSAILPRHKSGSHPHDDLKFWDRVVTKKICSLLETRNRIAHHPVEIRQATISHIATATTPAGSIVANEPDPPVTSEAGDVATFIGTVAESWFEIYESQNEQLRGKSAPKSPLLIDDLRAHLSLTRGASDVLYRFYYERLIHHVSALPRQDAQR